MEWLYANAVSLRQAEGDNMLALMRYVFKTGIYSAVAAMNIAMAIAILNADADRHRFLGARNAVLFCSVLLSLLVIAYKV